MNSRKKLKSSKERGSDQKATRCGKRASDYHPHALPSFIRTSMATDTRSKLYILSHKTEFKLAPLAAGEQCA